MGRGPPDVVGPGVIGFGVMDDDLLDEKEGTESSSEGEDDREAGGVLNADELRLLCMIGESGSARYVRSVCGCWIFAGYGGDKGLDEDSDVLASRPYGDPILAL